MRRFECPNPACQTRREPTPQRVVKAGFYRRRDDGRYVQRYLCRHCGKRFSSATLSDTYRLKLRRINRAVRWELCMKGNLRHIAAYLKVTRKTVVRRLFLFAGRGRIHLETLRREAQIKADVTHVHFDELQSSIHTKCKPVAIPIAVEAGSRRILALRVASMPAQHPLVEKALAKYGPRPDDRPEAISAVISELASFLRPGSRITTDAAPRYPEPIAKLLPGTEHEVHLSRRGGSWGQGEMKRIGRDPLFFLNHTAATMRDRMSRLVRRTWANSKRADHLEAHLLVYAHFHNEFVVKGDASSW